MSTQILSPAQQHAPMHAPAPPTPAHILQVGLGFWASKTLLTATQLGLFTLLGEKPLSAQAIKSSFKWGCSDRHVFDFLDALVSLGFLQREGLLDGAVYYNTIETAVFLDQNQSSYLGGILEMANRRLFHFWGNLEDALDTGMPQNEVKAGAPNPFEAIYADKEHLRQFMKAMAGLQFGNFLAFSQQFDFGKYTTIADIGGADATLLTLIAQQNEHIHGINFDLPPVAELALENIEAKGLSTRIKAVGGNFLEDKLPRADLLILGNILHDLGEATKQMLIQKSFDALPEGGALVVIENVIDNDRRINTFGLLMSLTMLIEFGDNGFDYTYDDFKTWANAAGFKKVDILPLAGPSSAVIAYK